MKKKIKIIKINKQFKKNLAKSYIIYILPFHDLDINQFYIFSDINLIIITIIVCSSISIYLGIIWLNKDANNAPAPSTPNNGNTNSGNNDPKKPDDDDEKSLLAKVGAFLYNHRMQIAWGIVIAVSCFYIYDNWEWINKQITHMLPVPTEPHIKKWEGVPSFPFIENETAQQRLARRLKETEECQELLNRYTAKLYLTDRNPVGSVIRSTLYTQDGNKGYENLLNILYQNTFKFEPDLPKPKHLVEAINKAERIVESILSESECAEEGYCSEETAIEMSNEFLFLRESGTWGKMSNTPHRYISHNRLQGREMDHLMHFIEKDCLQRIYERRNAELHKTTASSPLEETVHSRFRRTYNISMLIAKKEPAAEKIITELKLNPELTDFIARKFLTDFETLKYKIEKNWHPADEIFRHIKTGVETYTPCHEICPVVALMEAVDLHYGYYMRGIVTESVKEAIQNGDEIKYHKEYIEAYEKLHRDYKTDLDYLYWKHRNGY